MPVPGPRFGQDRSAQGYGNPDEQLPLRFLRVLPRFLAWAGQSPGLMETDLRGMVLLPVQVRRFWRQAIDYVAPQAPSSWTSNTPGPPGGPGDAFQVVGQGITRALRYKTQSFYVAAGTDGTRFSELHTVVLPHARGKPVTVAAGSVRYAPTVRNRLTSFGSRVPPLNPRVSAAEDTGA